jgi:hypothetical protein
MNINKNNYEAFFLDYHEGNFSPQQVADLLLFIEQNPELREEFESFENITLEDSSDFTFENKSGLKKEITLENKDEYFIRSIENTLSPGEKILVTDFIKQHPHYSNDLELFQKTKLVADASIVFENKEALKKTVVTTDDLLIASLEGLLTRPETALLNQQIAVDSEMQHHLHLYQQTKLVADTTIVYENKEELKRKERRAIPLFYYVAVAASLLFLFGLYFMFNNDPKQQNLAKNNEPKIKNELLTPKKNQEVIIKNEATDLAQVPVQKNVVVKNTSNKKENNYIEKKDFPTTPSLNNESSIANNQTPANQAEPLANNALPANKNEEPVTNNQTLAPVENKNETTKDNNFLSIRELAVEKIKEKTLDENTIDTQKKTGKLKRFSGWDIAQIATKGISKLTGRNLEVKPTYNEEGVVTAYALGNGIERTIGR